MNETTNNNGNGKLRINTEIGGEPAKWLKEWKERGLVSNYTDAIIQAFRVFHQQIVEQDFKNAQRKTIMRELGYEER